jgi:hypothetical protein
LTKAKEKFKILAQQEVSQWVQGVFDNTNDFELEYFQISEPHQHLCKTKIETKYRAFIAVLSISD